MVASLNDGVACRRCWQAEENTRLDFDFCEKCDLSLPRLLWQAQARRCGLCEEHAYVQARTCGNYRGALRENVLQLKMRPVIARQLQQRMLATFGHFSQPENLEVILPVPLHLSRQRERSFNQAEVMGRVLARATGLPMYTTALQRTKATERHRVGMDARARQKSIAGAFAVQSPRLVANHSILLVDDVMTTGTTAHEIAVTLLAAGAREVLVLALARAVTQFLP
ncbi:MAG: ComF family protein [Blastocatellia bacterium]